jgi:4-hydroxy-3-polyprenylbenzoate decarboxylase
MATLLSNVRHSTEIDRAVSVLPMALFQSGPATRDLRGFLKLLEERGQLKRITGARGSRSGVGGDR